MFTQKRKNYKTFIYTAIIITLCLLIIAIAWPAPPEENPSANPDERVNAGLTDNGDEDKDGDGEQTYNNSGAAGSEWGDGDDEDDDGEDNEEDNFPTVEKPNMMTEGQSYYLVKKAGDAIKVFFVDQSGNKVELETTNIIYDVLGLEDQKLFEEGYKVGSQEELAMLLQDFES